MVFCSERRVGQNLRGFDGGEQRHWGKKEVAFGGRHLEQLMRRLGSSQEA